MQAALEKLEGVVSAQVSLKEKEAVVRFIKGKVTTNAMFKAVEEAGYGADIKFKPVDVSADQSIQSDSEKEEINNGKKGEDQTLDELDKILTRTPYKGAEEQLQVVLTLVTPEYLRALHKLEQKEGKTDLTFVDYEKKYRIDEAIPFLVKFDTHTINTSEFDVLKAAVLIDRKGEEHTAIDWKELPSPMPMMASHHRRGILLFPKIEKTEGIEVILRGQGNITEKRFKW